MMKFYMLVAALCGSISTLVFADDQDVYGLWETNKTDRGYLLVEVKKCDDDLCGVVKKAFHKNGVEASGYIYLGKNIFWGMKRMPKKGAGFYGSGTILSPVSGKQYRGAVKFIPSDGVLKVSGKLGPFQQTYKWKKVTKEVLAEKTKPLNCWTQVQARRITFGTRGDSQMRPEVVCGN